MLNYPSKFKRILMDSFTMSLQPVIVENMMDDSRSKTRALFQDVTKKYYFKVIVNKEDLSLFKRWFMQDVKNNIVTLSELKDDVHFYGGLIIQPVTYDLYNVTFEGEGTKSAKSVSQRAI